VILYSAALERIGEQIFVTFVTRSMHLKKLSIDLSVLSRNVI
jgi:hypothetical protein